MLPGKDITKLTFSTIKKAVEEYIEPRKRLIIADRTQFLQMKQNAGESEVDFLTRLNDASTHCNWDSLKMEKPSEELVKLRFIAGLQDDTLKFKILEKLQLNPSTTTTEILDSCQMHSQLSKFVTPTTGSAEGTHASVENFFVGKSRSRCRNCGLNHPPRQCPAYAKICNNCGKRNHFAKCCRQRTAKYSSKDKESETNFSSNSVDLFSAVSYTHLTLPTILLV